MNEFTGHTTETKHADTVIQEDEMVYTDARANKLYSKLIINTNNTKNDLRNELKFKYLYHTYKTNQEKHNTYHHNSIVNKENIKHIL